MASCVHRSVVLIFLVELAVTVFLVSAQRSNSSTSPWQTLSGDEPVVIARGGFSGLLPDSSGIAYDLAKIFSLPNVILWCDVQLTKEGAGICLSNLLLNDVTSMSAGDMSTYPVNGLPTTGFFSVDYTLDDLAAADVYLVQAVLSRSERFNDNRFPILTVEDVALQHKPPGLWLNIQHDAFFTQHNLSMRSYVLSVSKRVIVNYLSSPEVGFLRSIVTRFRGSKTKLIFRFLEADTTEPSTNQTYGSLLKNLTFVKTFSSGILVPKTYIWPVNSGQYLLPHTSLVTDAHREGLEVFASDFTNDSPFSYNYSYDPVAEYLSFVDNGDFSVDGVLSDFPVTPSEAIGCFSHVSRNSSEQVKLAIISHNGASGVYPDSTDLAYKQAVEDGADYIDCTVQMTSDGIPICLSSVNLFDGTTVAQSLFGNLAVKVPEIQDKVGIFTFNLTWKDIQSLKPTISAPARDYNLSRSPAHRNEGVFLSLDDFLSFSKSKRLAGILISIEHAAYLAEKKGMSITDAVLDALSRAGYNQTTQEVVIQSTNSSVLTRVKEQFKYKLMYKLDEDIRSADDSSIKDIKSFADIVAISKESIFPLSKAFITERTDIVSRLKSFNLTVYVYLFRNEFVEQAWDFFADPIVEINTFTDVGIDGVITDFPGTAAAYRRNGCLKMGDDKPMYMMPVRPGDLLHQLVAQSQLPPAEAPNPVLTENDVAEGPLPPVSKVGPTANPIDSAPPPNSPRPSGHPRLDTCIFLWSLSMLLVSCLLF